MTNPCTVSMLNNSYLAGLGYATGWMIYGLMRPHGHFSGALLVKAVFVGAVGGTLHWLCMRAMRAWRTRRAGA